VYFVHDATIPCRPADIYAIDVPGCGIREWNITSLDAVTKGRIAYACQLVAEFAPITTEYVLNTGSVRRVAFGALVILANVLLLTSAVDAMMAEVGWSAGDTIDR
jgi:hypothetical protein